MLRLQQPHSVRKRDEGVHRVHRCRHLLILRPLRVVVALLVSAARLSQENLHHIWIWILLLPQSHICERQQLEEQVPAVAGRAGEARPMAPAGNPQSTSSDAVSPGKTFQDAANLDALADAGEAFHVGVPAAVVLVIVIGKAPILLVLLDLQHTKTTVEEL